MNGPEHYRQAEMLIDRAHTLQSDNGPGCGSEEELAEAQVHATLAVAAATALDTTERQMHIREAQRWNRVLSFDVDIEEDSNA